VEIVALAVEEFEFHFVENGAIDKFFGAETIVDNRSAFEVFHARLHGAALVAWRAVVDAKNRKELALVLDDHTGAKLRGFDAAHIFRGRGAARAPLNLRFQKFQLAAAELRDWLRAE
jgi:hypothetical protein